MLCYRRDSFECKCESYLICHYRSYESQTGIHWTTLTDLDLECLILQFFSIPPCPHAVSLSARKHVRTLGPNYHPKLYSVKNWWELFSHQKKVHPHWSWYSSSWHIIILYKRPERISPELLLLQSVCESNGETDEKQIDSLFIGHFDHPSISSLPSLGSSLQLTITFSGHTGSSLTLSTGQ